jgi:hypothetical protein
MLLHFGGMSDPLLIPSAFNYVTLEILKILDEYQYPTLISTKSDIVSNEEFAKIILGKKHFALQISFSTFDDDIALLIEPKSPSPSQRLTGVRSAINAGNWVACRLQPFFPSLKIDSVMNLIVSSGFKHVTIEHFKLPFDGTINLKLLEKAFDVKFSYYFPKEKRIKNGREFEMPFDIRIANIRKFLDVAKKLNIFIGIGDNGFQHLSTSQCCCGIDTLPGFENWHKYNVTELVKRAIRKNGRIMYELIANEWVPESNISWVINSKTRLKSSFDSVKNHLKVQWKNNKIPLKNIDKKIKEVNFLIDHIDNRIHYTETRITRTVTFSVTLIAIGMGFFTAAIKLNGCSLYLGLIATGSLILTGLITALIHIFQVNPNYPFKSLPKDWKWFYPRIVDEKYKPKAFVLEKKKAYFEKRLLHVDGLSKYAKNIINETTHERLKVDIQQLYLLHVNEKYKNYFLTTLRKVLNVGLAIVLISLLVLLLNISVEKIKSQIKEPSKPQQEAIINEQ